jgi:hypothetical protein
MFKIIQKDNGNLGAVSLIFALGCATLLSTLPMLTSCKEQNSQLGCYTLSTEEDTLQLSLSALYPSVSGRMIYDGGSDHYIGIITGTMHGDTLIGKYSAGVEGSALTTPIAFLRRPNGYIKGDGELVMRDGKFEFERLSALKFGNVLLKSVPCSK